VTAADLLFDEARALIDARRYRVAIRRLKESAPDGVTRDRLLGLAYVGHRAPTTGLAHLRRSMAIAPDDAETLRALAHAQQAANAPFLAVLWFERLARLAPHTSGIRAALAGAYRRDARYRDALAVTRQALSEGERSLDLLFETATSQACLGQDSEALVSFHALLADDPEHAAGWFGSHAQAMHSLGPEEALR
jgi:Flp pilus assembly protein TadD